MRLDLGTIPPSECGKSSMKILNMMIPATRRIPPSREELSLACFSQRIKGMIPLLVFACTVIRSVTVPMSKALC
jgi:hypothetical protein